MTVDLLAVLHGFLAAFGAFAALALPLAIVASACMCVRDFNKDLKP